jgi:hypothetical protein
MPTMQAIETEPRGTWWQRLLIAIFSLALTLLFFWALGFILQDIGRLPGPDWNRLSGDRLDPVMAATTARLGEEQAAIKRQIENEERRRQVLRDSTATSQKTLGQLLELQRMSLEQQTSLPEEQQQALAESQRVFLANQQRDQDLTESISDHQERQAAIAEELRQHLEHVNVVQTPVREEYQRLQTSHRLRLAAIKIGGVLLGSIVYLNWISDLAVIHQVLIAMFVLAVGILSVFGLFTAGRELESRAVIKSEALAFAATLRTTICDQWLDRSQWRGPWIPG